MPLWWKLLQLRFGTSRSRWRAMAYLEETPRREAVPALLRLIYNSSLSSRAVEVLGKCRDRRAVEPLVGLVRDPLAPSRFGAAKALGAIGDPAAVPLLVDALAARDRYFPTGAVVAALGVLGDRAAIPPLEALLVAPDIDESDAWVVRTAAAEALGRLGATPADPDVALEMAIALGRIEPVAARGLAALERMGHYSTRTTCDLLAGLDWGAATEVQKATGVEIARRVLAGYIRGREQLTKDSAPHRAVSRIGHPRTVALLSGGCDEKQWFDWCYHLLPSLPTKILVDALDDPVPRFRRDAAKALEKHPCDEVAPALAARHADPDEYVRRDVLDVLRATAKSDRGRTALVKVLPDLLNFVDDPSSHNRTRAAEVLREIPDPRAAEGLFRLLDDGDVWTQLAAIEALTARKDRRLAGRLAGVARGCSGLVSGRIVDAIDALDDPDGFETLVVVLQRNADRFCAKALDVAERLLRRDAAVLPDSALRRVAALPASRSWEWRGEDYIRESPTYDEYIPGSVHTATIEFAELKRLAQTELARRKGGGAGS